MDNGLKLSHKLILIVVISVVIFSAIFEITFYSISRNEILDRYKDEAVSLTLLASRELRNPLYFLDLYEIEHAIQNIKQNPDVQSVYVMFPDGRIITDGTMENKYYNQTLNDCLNIHDGISPDEPLVKIENDVLHVCIPIIISEKIGMVKADFSLNRLNEIVNNLIITLLMIGGILSIIVIIVGLFISRSISKRILKLKYAANEISKGNFDVDIREISARNDEIAELSSQFNIMKQYIVSTNKHLNRLVKERTRELEIANEQLKMQGKMQREFINTASHEMKTPIQAILSYSQLLQMYPERQNEITQAINRNSLRLQRLSNDILDVTKIESRSLKLNKEIFDLNVISNIIEDHKSIIAKENYNVKLLFYPSKETLLVEADKERIVGVISNLLSNAIKFTKEGEIFVSTEMKEDNNNNYALVTVKDTGEGIDPEILPKIFSKFTTKSFEGIGLGLYISKYIVESHGGKILAENNIDGKGATFSFTLPLLKSKTK
ncbi:MAG TPA: HAMP domain-containing sensor histidine kinase [Nitrososphaeraceae archaeon]